MSAVAAPPAIRVAGVTRRFGRTVALRGVDLEIAQGDRLALFGANGSGKTTLLKVLAGLLPPTRGEVSFNGDTHRSAAQALRRRIGVLSHHTYLYDDLTGEENLLFYARMYGLPDARSRVQEALTVVGMDQRARDKVRAYSRGMQQRLALARTTLHDPDVLLLDEPDTGLDQEAFAAISRFLDRPSGIPRTVVMATHDLKLGHAYCTRFAILAAGRVVHDAPMSGFDLPALEDLYWQAAR